MLYTIYPSYKDQGFSFNLRGNNIDDILDFFKFDISNNFLKQARINLSFDKIFLKKLENILSHDFYFSSSGLLLFSEAFYEDAQIFLKEDGVFFECLLQNEKAGIYAFYIKNKASIFKTNNTSNYKIIRDIDKPYCYAVSDEFVKYVKDKKFKMNFLPL